MIFAGLKDCEGKTMISYVTVFERPGLQEFLKQIGEFADLVLFTAGLEGRCNAIGFVVIVFILLCCFYFYLLSLGTLQVMLDHLLIGLMWRIDLVFVFIGLQLLARKFCLYLLVITLWMVFRCCLLVWRIFSLREGSRQTNAPVLTFRISYIRLFGYACSSA